MPFNLLKKYSELLEINHLSHPQRLKSLQGVFDRDITNNTGFKFRLKQIRPTTEDGVPPLQTLFKHLTTRNDVDQKGNKLKSRSFELDRSARLHWIKYHIEEKNPEKLSVFSYEDRIDGKSVVRTYVYDKDEEYVIILEPQRSKLDYYLLTAYHLNEPGGKKQIEKKEKRKLDDIY
ncbi:MAG: hypothetical protein RJQ00_02745 [Vicingaceae bacterium]